MSDQEKPIVLRPGCKVVVTNDDIVNGEGGSPTCCAVALAVRRLLPHDFYPYVVADWMEIVRRGGQTVQRIELPYEVGEWVASFDEFCEYSSCNTEKEFEHFWEQHNDGEPYEVWPVEPIEFAVPV